MIKTGRPTLNEKKNTSLVYRMTIKGKKEFLENVKYRKYYGFSEIMNEWVKKFNEECENLKGEK